MPKEYNLDDDVTKIPSLEKEDSTASVRQIAETEKEILEELKEINEVLGGKEPNKKDTNESFLDKIKEPFDKLLDFIDDIQELIDSFKDLSESLFGSESVSPQDIKPGGGPPPVNPAAEGAGEAGEITQVEAAAGGVEEVAAVAALAEGGSTSDNMFIVGEQGPELVQLTDSGANIYNQEQTASRFGVDLGEISKNSPAGESFKEMPGFASGGSYDKHTGEVLNLQDVPAYAGGGTLGEIGATIGGGGTTQGGQPEDIIASVFQPLEMAADAFSDDLGNVVRNLEYFTQAITTTTEAFNTLARDLAPFSAQISAAEARVEVETIQTKLSINDKIGGDLADLYESSNEIWLTIRDLMASLEKGVLSGLVPLVNEVNEFLQNNKDWIATILEGIGDILGLILRGVADIVYIVSAGLKHLHNIDNNTEKEHSMDMMKYLLEANNKFTAPPGNNPGSVNGPGPVGRPAIP